MIHPRFPSAAEWPPGEQRALLRCIRIRCCGGYRQYGRAASFPRASYWAAVEPQWGALANKKVYYELQAEVLTLTENLVF